jgi:glycosyltransferase 2 family protein
MSRPKATPRSLLVNLVLAAIGFGLLAWTVHSNRAEIRAVFGHRPDARLCAAGFAVYMVALVATFVRWWVLVRAQGIPLPLRDAVRLGFIGNLFNLVIPGAVGGDLIKAAFLYRLVAPHDRTRALASMVIDRLIGLLGLFLLASATGWLAWRGSGPEARRLILAAWVAAAAGALGLAVLFAPALYRPLARLVAGRPRLAAIVRDLGAMGDAYRARIKVVLATLVMAACIHGLYVISFYTVSLALFGGRTPGLSQHLIIVPLVLFTTAVPLPFGALGLTEKVSGVLFKLVRHPGGAVAMMAYRAVMYAAGLVCAGVYLANIVQVRALAAEGLAAEPAEPEAPAELGSRLDPA